MASLFKGHPVDVKHEPDAGRVDYERDVKPKIAALNPKDRKNLGTVDLTLESDEKVVEKNVPLVSPGHNETPSVAKYGR